jgi:tRNA G18 (ribose-2'-O)-methylase SpoU
MDRLRARVVRIDDIHDVRVAPYAGVGKPESLSDRGLVLIEGRLVVRRLLGSGRVRFLSLLLNDAALRALEDVLDPIDEEFEVYVAEPAIIHAVTGFNMHRGCLAVAERPPSSSMEAVVPSAAFVAVLERVVDTDNIGAVFRNAEAFGLEAVLLSPGCGDPFYRKAIRTSSGATLTVPFAAAAPWPRALHELRAAGFVTVALTPDHDAMAIGTFVGTAAARGRVAVLLGTEGDGLTDEALAATDVRVRIPMHGPGERAASVLNSLNIATAAGIALHRLHEVRDRSFREGE